MIKQEKLAANGPKFSKLILGLWRLQDLAVGDIATLINTALEHGITTIDQADIYGNYQSQKYFGKLLQKENSLRDNIQIVSKTGIHLPNSKFTKSGIGYYNTSKNHIINSVNQSLADLNTDYLDLLLIHRPDPLMNPNELDEAFFDLKKTGKVLHFGVSNFTPSQFDMLQLKLETPLVTNQVEYSVLHYKPLFDGTFDNCLKHSVSPMLWSPLAGGSLFTEKNEQIARVTKELDNIRKELGAATIDLIALAWVMQHPSNPFTIIGSQKPERITSATEATKIILSREQWFRILIAAQGHSVP